MCVKAPVTPETPVTKAGARLLQAWDSADPPLKDQRCLEPGGGGGLKDL
ncbi:hypothetical protein FOXG_19032 [Fusarium oxysporum f. sp. lycopersici 4287]|uniref:Uncharacterized protein n=1 Tax=Fusarium oxysporum f. sp. lycopersici (strain 4287 / CBS 123668 / FGSC 9935 / NRRL 34936) TaxID=426428 RepID=A0A0J9US79_FUSO4|nr:hypothetical protein FOXG_19032 [Fusarium oxysporum f. sp. lycopersici 4287]KNB02434.1 hypothetical protein FOXG_19032 [Fusarium oxysporum f. sp. lycopersici 4287]